MKIPDEIQKTLDVLSTNNPGDWKRYELAKKILNTLILSPYEYEKAIKRYCERARL